MEDYIFVGCDSHEKTLVNKIALNREAAETKRFAADREGRQKLIGYLKQRSQRAGSVKVIVAYEASSHGFNLCDELKVAGLECHVLAPTRIERSTNQKRHKNDDRDADQLLDIVRSHYLAGTTMPAVWVPDKQTRDDREPVRARQDLTEKQTKVKTQVQMLLKRHGLEKPEGIGKNWTKRYGEWLQGLSQDGSRATLGMRTGLRSLLRQLDFLEKEIQQMDQALKDLGRNTTAETDRRGIDEAKRCWADHGIEVHDRHRRFHPFPPGTAGGSIFWLNPLQP